MNEHPPRQAPSLVPVTGAPGDTAGPANESTDGPRTTPASHPPAPGGAAHQLGGYTIVRKLGEGGMGAVYLAEDPKLGRMVAIKTMRPELAANALDRSRFGREAVAAANLDSDHIVPVLHLGEAADGTPFIVMPFLQGETLHDRLRREPRAPVGLILKVAREVAEGLGAVHAKGLVHRDIKPANVWLEGDPAAPEPAQQVRRCKILDFGLARSPGDTQLTATGAVVGTPAYMAPEQAKGERVDGRADLFGLGVVLYRMAAGRLPFDGSTPVSVLVAITTDAPPPLRELAPNLPGELADLVARLLSKDPAERPTAAAVAAIQLDDPEGRRTAPTVPVPVAPLGPGPDHGLESTQMLSLPADRGGGAAPTRRPVVWVAGAVALVALVALAALVWRLTHGPEQPAGPDTAQKGPAADPPPQEPKDKGPPKGPAGEPRKADPPRAAVDPDRAAAEYVLRAGGGVRVNGAGDEIRAPAGLPAGPFQLTDVTLGGPVPDADLAVFDGCVHVTVLYLVGTGITDAGLAHFKNCADLTELYLSGTRVTDDGAARVARFAKLTYVSVAQTRMTETGARAVAEALPACTVHWDGGTIEPLKK